MRSLRARLLLGAGLISLLAILAALLAAVGTIRATRWVEETRSSQQRFELLAGLSGRVSEYGLVAAELAEAKAPPGLRALKLGEASAAVDAAFGRLEAAVAAGVAAAPPEPAEARMRLATRGVGLARMRAAFRALEASLAAADFADGGAALRVALDVFATRFSPILAGAIEEERRDRDHAAAGIARIHPWMVGGAVAVALLAPLALLALHLLTIRPLLRRLAEVARAAGRLGRGGTGLALAPGRRDELGLLAARVNLMAARLERRRAAVERDRARLAELVEARTADLRAANERLSKADEFRRRFFADVSHELRTPLTVILAESELAETGEDAERREAIGVIRARARRLARRIDDLLRVARSESGRLELARAPVDLAQAARAAAEDQERLLARRRMRLETLLEPGLVAEGDAEWLRQIVGGLIENAAKFAPEGSTIRLSARRAAGLARISVADEGPGVPEAARERVFDRFARLDAESGPDSGPGGFGVGLALARWVAEAHGGGLSIGAGPGGRGAEAALTLPLAEAGALG